MGRACGPRDARRVQEVSTLNQYEAMFLFDPAVAPDFAKAKEEMERILRRADAEILFLEKWDERKLAYDIKGRKRGLYVLTYFKCDGGRVVGIERDARLSKAILRILITRAEGVSREQMEHYLPQHRAAEEDHGEADESADRPRPRRGEGFPRPATGPKPEEAAVAVAEDDDVPELD